MILKSLSATSRRKFLVGRTAFTTGVMAPLTMWLLMAAPKGIFKESTIRDLFGRGSFYKLWRLVGVISGIALCFAFTGVLIAVLIIAIIVPLFAHIGSQPIKDEKPKTEAPH